MLLSVIVLIGSSCTVHKRVHRKGWYVEWNHSKHSNNIADKVQTPIQEEPDTEVALLDEDKRAPASIESTVIEIDTEANTSKKALESISTKEINGSLKAEHQEVVQTSKCIQIANQLTENEERIQHQNSPTRAPTLAWVLLFIGLTLLAIGIVAAIIFAIINLTFIGLPLQYSLALIAGILILILATGVALSNMGPQPSSPDPRYEKQEPKKEKKERQPLKKNDKIFLAIIGFVALGVLIAILSF